MPRAATALDSKLAQLDPLAVAREVCEAVVGHLGRLAFSLSPAWDCPPLPAAERLAEASDLGLTVQALVQYAQRGLPVWDWPDHGCASDACLPVLSALYSQAGAPDLGGGALDDEELDLDSDVGLVLVAARARIRLDQRGELTPRDLEALSGLSRRSVQRLCDAGEIAATRERGDYTVPADEARRWLSSRRVPGL